MSQRRPMQMSSRRWRSRSIPGRRPRRAMTQSPETGEGRKELSERAKKSEEHRDLAMARYHHYEIGSAAFQIGIVLASGVITGMMALTWLAGCLGLAGLALTAIGLFAPHAVHLF